MSVAGDTIFALSSGRPPAAIAVVRISGPRAGAALQLLMGRVPEPRKAVLARLRDPVHGEVIDEALALWFPGPNSETGEDTAELQVHGGRAVIAAAVGALGRMEGLRPAEAGEFTRRAFENGRLDLTAVEGLADLIGAETEAQRRQAYCQLKGFLGNRAETWRRRLIAALALVDARIDFSDEADVPADLVGPALDAAQLLRSEIAETLDSASHGERLREGLVVAIAGPPNAGKSTLLNRIARREAAIVSPIPGTTRDVIEVHLDLDGYPVTLLDTAGIRDSDDPVEQEGVRRAKLRAGEADLLLWVQDAGAASRLGGSEALGPAPATWFVMNKIDLVQTQRLSSNGIATSIKESNNVLKDEFKSSYIFYYVSATTGEGMEQFLTALSRYAAEFFGTEPALISRQRHRTLLEATLAALDRALAEGVGGREDIIAEELRAAAHALGRLTGRIDVEDILEVIFRDFCIGK